MGDSATARGLSDKAIEALRLRRMSLRIGALFLAVVSLHLLALRMPFELGGALAPLALLGTLLAGGLATARQNPASNVGTAATGTALVIGCSLLGAALSMLVLRWGMPQADEALLAVDGRIGVGVPGVIDAVSQWPVLTSILYRMYGTSIPLLIVTVMVLGLAGQAVRMWRACLMFAGCLLTICLGSGLMPAKGAFLFVGAETIDRLPLNAGTYAFETFDQFTSSQPESLSLAALNGVACFPSFHTAAALILCQCGWSVVRLRPVLALWGGVVIFSTIPIGGHYLVDLFAGAGVFAVWSWIVRPRLVVKSADPLPPALSSDWARA